MSELTEAEKKILLIIRQLRPFEVIEIKLNENRADQLAVVVKSTVKEIFPLDDPK